jgi:hypothetical protein
VWCTRPRMPNSGVSIRVATSVQVDCAHNKQARLSVLLSPMFGPGTRRRSGHATEPSVRPNEWNSEPTRMHPLLQQIAGAVR